MFRTSLSQFCPIYNNFQICSLKLTDRSYSDLIWVTAIPAASDVLTRFAHNSPRLRGGIDCIDGLCLKVALSGCRVDLRGGRRGNSVSYYNLQLLHVGV